MNASDSTDRPPLPWHATGAGDVQASVGGGPGGLDSAEAARRLAETGPNSLPEGKRRGPLARFAGQFHNLLIHVLLAAALLAAVLGQPVDAGVILAVVLINAIVGHIQEGRAERAIEAIGSMIGAEANVLRDGRRRVIEVREIVPGDIVLLEAGDRVPADLRLLAARNLRIDESVLTGESVAVEKSTEAVAAEAQLGDRRSMAHSGSLVVAGQGRGIAVATGAASELGRIGTLVGSVVVLKTPLLRQMDGFARLLTLVILAFSLATFLAAVFLRGYPLPDAFMAVVGLAVAAIPEGLPAIMTITLAIGVGRMAARHAIIRRLPAVETLGAVSVICTDKTGTLTRNEMMAATLVTAGGEHVVTGVGYDPDGEIAGRDDADAALTDLLRAGLLCNDAELRKRGQGWRVDGDPMEGALLVLAMKAGLKPGAMREDCPRLDAIPFDAAHRFMATLHRDEDEVGSIFIKGAPETILGMCGRERTAEGEREIDRTAWQVRAEALAATGKRVLAFAFKPGHEGKLGLDFADVDSDAVLLGLVGFIDPPRSEAIEAVAECRAAGIRVIMITGDHAGTAREIARRIGIDEHPELLTGKQMDALDDAGLLAAASRVKVFARTTPEHKLRLVEALQAAGGIVAMTGDGVNDAPALKRADVGIAMGGKGSDAAREAAAMVLADDNFASIAAAVREGRTVYDNITKVIGWTLPTSSGEAMAIILAIALGHALPITPLQILWVNMVTAVALGLTLAFEPTEPGTMRRPPRGPGTPLLSGALVWRILFVSLLFVAGVFGMFHWSESRGDAIELSRTLVVNTIVVMEIFYLFSVRYLHGTALTWRGLPGTPAVLAGVAVTVALQMVFTYAPPMHGIFASRPVGITDGVAIVGVGVLLLILVEIEKRLRTAVCGAGFQVSGSRSP